MASCCYQNIVFEWLALIVVFEWLIVIIVFGLFLMKLNLVFCLDRSSSSGYLHVIFFFLIFDKQNSKEEI